MHVALHKEVLAVYVRNLARAFLFVQLGQAAFRLVGTASHLVVIAIDSSNVIAIDSSGVHSQPLDSCH
jgi:hypothetical protein